ncbi:hypothetical protein GCM10010123_00910 [Pilimelia anulata]|uniref:Uncharacterized protein n=1 Tax=Pilimelia anulata TaxID=53371 RepID=A0A8J3B357_9ACTN|nr:hypothetical protein [Pilimelia anulata]GGJ74776.1 hypothetical protein GCM10010123_00910 [Pilimelia anulata]
MRDRRFVAAVAAALVGFFLVVVSVRGWNRYGETRDRAAGHLATAERALAAGDLPRAEQYAGFAEGDADEADLLHRQSQGATGGAVLVLALAGWLAWRGTRRPAPAGLTAPATP